MAGKKKIVFIHYRVGERDGVSLEIEKRARLFEEMGHSVYFISGRDGIERKNSHVIDEMELGHTAATFLRDGCFYKKMFDENVMMTLYYAMENAIQKKLHELFERIQPDLVFVHNMFSHCYNLPATTALIKVLDRYQSPTMVVNHDFWFDRPQFHHPKYFFVEQILETLPPTRSYFVRQQVINTNAYSLLMKRRKVEAEVIGDSFDFTFAASHPMEMREEIRSQLGVLPNDILVVHATRVTQRKAIENAIIYCDALQKTVAQHNELALGGKSYSRDSRVFLLLPNFVEVDAKHYAEELESYAQRLGVKLLWAADMFAFYRSESDLKKKFSFWDSYAAADIVTYTSTQEGFGNQFLEGVAFRKPVVLLEYPVFKDDIKPEGYKYISMGSEVFKRNGFQLVPRSVAEKAAKETLKFMKDPHELSHALSQNYTIAKKFHDESLLEKSLRSIVATI